MSVRGAPVIARSDKRDAVTPRKTRGRADAPDERLVR